MASYQVLATGRKLAQIQAQYMVSPSMKSSVYLGNLAGLVAQTWRMAIG